jgi:hypothetical protein
MLLAPILLALAPFLLLALGTRSTSLLLLRFLLPLLLWLLGPSLCLLFTATISSITRSAFSATRSLFLLLFRLLLIGSVCCYWPLLLLSPHSVCCPACYSVCCSVCCSFCYSICYSICHFVGYSALLLGSSLGFLLLGHL